MVDRSIALPLRHNYFRYHYSTFFADPIFEFVIRIVSHPMLFVILAYPILLAVELASPCLMICNKLRFRHSPYTINC